MGLICGLTNETSKPLDIHRRKQEARTKSKVARYSKNMYMYTPKELKSFTKSKKGQKFGTIVI